MQNVGLGGNCARSLYLRFFEQRLDLRQDLVAQGVLLQVGDVLDLERVLAEGLSVSTAFGLPTVSDLMLDRIRTDSEVVPMLGSMFKYLRLTLLSHRQQSIGPRMDPRGSLGVLGACDGLLEGLLPVVLFFLILLPPRVGLMDQRKLHLCSNLDHLFGGLKRGQQRWVALQEQS